MRSFRAEKVALSLEAEKIQYHVFSFLCKQATNILWVYYQWAKATSILSV